jgi:poly(A) polymerase
LLVRYTRDDSGKTTRQALIYTADEHGIKPGEIHPDAVKIAHRLRSSGHKAYIVGGAVRDLMLGKHPKDFDLATDAQPNRIRRLFRNSRVIGKRFRLVHVFFKDHVIEVSTFRSENSKGFQNEYGEIEEDVMRRDFTANALYYDPVAERVVDYVDGVKDIRARRLVPVIPLDRIFAEDPVRMIRAIKYSVGGDLRMDRRLRRLIKRSSDLLADISPSRITEEVFKILLSGRSRRIIEECDEFGLLPHMIPSLAQLISSDNTYRAAVLKRLDALDREVTEGNETRRARGIAYLAADYLFTKSESGRAKRVSFNEAFADIKRFIHPLVPANRDVEMGLVYLIRRRKNYERSGVLELTPPSERIHEQEEPETRQSVIPAGKRSSRRRRRPRRRSANSSPDSAEQGKRPPEQAK